MSFRRSLSSRRREYKLPMSFGAGAAVAALLVAVVLFAPLSSLKADAAGGGLLSPYLTAPIRWNGTAPGGVALNDPLGL